MQAQMSLAKDQELRSIERRKDETQRRIDESRARHLASPEPSGYGIPTMSPEEQAKKASRAASHSREKARVQQLELQSKVTETPDDFGQVERGFGVSVVLGVGGCV
jgi:hypothetical protein